MGLSNSQYAAYRGVSHPAVAKAMATGRITADADGTIDPAKADRQRDLATDPAKRRGVNARQLGADTARGTAAAKTAIGMKPVPQSAISAVNDTRTEIGADAPSGDLGMVPGRAKATLADVAAGLFDLFGLEL